MAEPVFNRFASFNLNEAETQMACKFTDLNQMLMHNERTKIAEQLLNLKMESGDKAEFDRNIAYMQGQLDFASWLIETAVSGVPGGEDSTPPVES